MKLDLSGTQQSNDQKESFEKYMNIRKENNVVQTNDDDDIWKALF